MGRPKALLPWRGRPMIEHVVEVLHNAVDEVVAVTSDELDLPPLRARVVRDEEPALGPLAGLAVGLGAVEAPLSYATSTDAPFLSPAFVSAVLGAGKAAAPVVDGFVQTLAAAYPSRDAAQHARRLLGEGRRRPLDLLEALDYRALEPSELPELRSLKGFNTPQEYLAAVAEEHGAARAVLEFVGEVRAAAGCESIRVPVGTLAAVLAHAPAPLELCEHGRVAPRFLISLGGRDFVRDGRIPIGPDERVVVLDSAAGG
jgi:molybdopterin-guanine dinucleotide biosynthesis protein A